MEAENLKKKRTEYHKKWREKNAERWREISLRAYHRRVADPDGREEYTLKHAVARLNRIENDPSYEDGEKLTSKLYYWQNCDEQRIKKRGNYYIRKMWNNRELHDDDEQMICCELQNLKDDNVLEYVIDNYEKYFQLKSTDNVNDIY